MKRNDKIFAFFFIVIFALFAVVAVFQSNLVNGATEYFGTTTIGGTPDPEGANNVYCGYYMSPSDAGGLSLTTISVYLSASSSFYAVAGIYSDNGPDGYAQPQTLLAQSSTTSCGKTAAWDNFTVSYTLSASTRYDLVVWSTSAITPYLASTSGYPYTHGTQSSGYPTLSSSASWAGSDYGFNLSIYGTYGSSPTPTPTSTPTSTPSGWQCSLMGVPNGNISQVGIGGVYLNKSQIQTIGGAP